jgi:hypothetical protein
MMTLNLQKAPFVIVSFLSLFAVHMTVNLLGTDDFSDERYFLNISSYSFGSEKNTREQSTTRLLKKLAVSLAIENSLLTIGKGTLATIIYHLRTMCNNSSLFDCYDHPEYLNIVLKTCSNDIYESCIGMIKTKLKDLANDKEIAEFLHKISK